MTLDDAIPRIPAAFTLCECYADPRGLLALGLPLTHDERETAIRRVSGMLLGGERLPPSDFYELVAAIRVHARQVRQSQARKDTL